MKIGISTASLFMRMYNEEAVSYLNSEGVPVCEVFLGTFREYEPSYAKVLKKNKGKMEVHSVHTLNTHFEPQLFSGNPRAKEDAYAIVRKVLESAAILKAEYYTFHGQARIKKGVKYNDYRTISKDFEVLINCCEEYGIGLALENVEWAFYNAPGFFSAIRQGAPGLKGTLDIKQAWLSGYDYNDYLNEMGRDIVTVHVCDRDASGNICVPCERGTVDFKELFKRLDGIGFNGSVLIEVYKNNYSELPELIRSLDYLNNILLQI